MTYDKHYYDGDWQRLWWVMVQGGARVLGRGSERPAALTELRRRYRQYVAMSLEDLPLIEVEPVRILEWDASPQT